MDFETREDNDGVRLSWTSLPKSKLQHQRNVIPMGALYTPLNNKTSISVLDQNCIISCRTCRAVLNPYSPINNSLWTCQYVIHLINSQQWLTLKVSHVTSQSQSRINNSRV